MIPKLLVTAAMMAVQVALGASQHFEGQRLDDLNVSTADNGTPKTYFWGTRKIEGCPIIHSEPLREKKTTSKTKGGKYDEYKYFWTGAVLIAGHEITGITRIWLDNHLAYDVTKKGPFSMGSMSSLKLNRQSNMRIYLGTEDQEPDPRYSSWCEDRYGADSATAFKGQAYLFFEELPVEKFGNRVPQVTVEAVSAKSDLKPYEQIADSGNVSWTGEYRQVGSWLTFANSFGENIEWWDTPSRTLLGTSSNPDLFGGAPKWDVAADGTAYIFGMYIVGVDVFTALWSCAPLGTPVVVANGPSDAWFADITRVFDLEDGTRKILTALDQDYGGTGYLDAGAKIESAYGKACDFAMDLDGDVWGLFQPDGSSAAFTLVNLTGTAGLFTITGLVTRSDKDDEATFCHTPFGHFFVISDGKYYLIDELTGAINGSGAFSGQTRNLPRKSPGSTSFWNNVTEVSLEDGSTLRTLAYLTWVNEDMASGSHYDPVNHALWAHPQFHQRQTIRYLDRFTGADTTLGTIVADVAERCGVTAINVDDLDQAVAGYSVVQGSGREMVEPLLALHDSDARCHDFELEFIKRGASPVGAAIATADFAADGGGPRFAQTITGDTDLPRRLTVSFADTGKDQQKNEVTAQRHRLAMDSDREPAIDMSTYASAAGDMQQRADRYLRRQWNDREQDVFALTAQQLARECGDVIPVELDELERNVRIERITISGSLLKVEAKRDHPSLATLSTGTGAEMDGRDDDAIFIPAPTRGIVIDIPLVRDADNAVNPKLYYGAAPYVGGFSGAIIQLSEDDGVNFSDWEAVDSASGATWGLATNALPNALSPWLWDRANSVNVRINSGGLSSVTEDAIDQNRLLNLAYLGGELFNFTTATLESNGSYTLSGLKRGRRGTEGWMAGHASGELFCMVGGLADAQLGLSDVGLDLEFRTQTAGRDPEGGQVQEIAFAGNSLKPYAPVRFRAVRNTATGDWTFTWRRRTRVGGAWVGGSVIPVGEASEAYELVIPKSGGSRTITAATQTATWTNSQQVADYGSAQTSLPAGIHVYQMSDSVGRGFASDTPLAA